jgi:hypothetical protein|tara:strand:+ start:512 stop:766 length:255 start_codon:yes stop_codon:yes gene_type:complete
MPKKYYKVKIDISKAIADLKALGLGEPKKIFWITVEAEDPDDCCAVSYTKVHDIVFNQQKSSKFKEAAEIIKKKMKILKITAQS